MSMEMITTSYQSVKVTLVAALKTLEPGTEVGLYRLPGGRHVIGYTDPDNGLIYQDPDAHPGDFGYDEDGRHDTDPKARPQHPSTGDPK